MREVLIFSTGRDVTTCKVMAWLMALTNGDIHIIRINDNEIKDIPSFSINNDNCTLKINEQMLEIDKNTKIWYRNGTLFQNPFSSGDLFADQIFNSEFNRYLDFLSYYLKSNSNFTGSILGEKYLNKLIVLDKAAKIGLKTPEYFITNSGIVPKTSFDYIVKSIGNISPFQIGDLKYVVDYAIYCQSKIVRPSFCYVQKYIDKEFEVRTFFFKGLFYSMAIFSQASLKTLIDYRNYDEQKPNRKVPFILPEEISNKLIILMEELELDSGSIDLIVSPDHEFYFLEVNPCGQLDWLSESCNYYIEKRIAKYFIE